jgi:hypothetical protein
LKKRELSGSPMGPIVISWTLGGLRSRWTFLLLGTSCRCPLLLWSRLRLWLLSLTLFLPLAVLLFLILLLLWALLYRRRLPHQRTPVLLRRSRSFVLLWRLRRLFLLLRTFRRSFLLLWMCLVLFGPALVLFGMILILFGTRLLLLVRLRAWVVSGRRVHGNALRLWARHWAWSVIGLNLGLRRARIILARRWLLRTIFITSIFVTAGLVGLGRHGASRGFRAHIGRSLALSEGRASRSGRTCRHDLTLDDTRRGPHLHWPARALDTGALRLNIHSMCNLGLRYLTLVHANEVSIHRASVDEGIA